MYVDTICVEVNNRSAIFSTDPPLDTIEATIDAAEPPDSSTPKDFTLHESVRGSVAADVIAGDVAHGRLQYKTSPDEGSENDIYVDGAEKYDSKETDEGNEGDIFQQIDEDAENDISQNDELNTVSYDGGEREKHAVYTSVDINFDYEVSSRMLKRTEHNDRKSVDYIDSSDNHERAVSEVDAKSAIEGRQTIQAIRNSGEDIDDGEYITPTIIENPMKENIDADNVGLQTIQTYPRSSNLVKFAKSGGSVKFVDANESMYDGYETVQAFAAIKDSDMPKHSDVSGATGQESGVIRPDEKLQKFRSNTMAIDDNTGHDAHTKIKADTFDQAHNEATNSLHGDNAGYQTIQAFAGIEHNHLHCKKTESTIRPSMRDGPERTGEAASYRLDSDVIARAILGHDTSRNMLHDRSWKIGGDIDMNLHTAADNLDAVAEDGNSVSGERMESVNKATYSEPRVEYRSYNMTHQGVVNATEDGVDSTKEPPSKTRADTNGIRYRYDLRSLLSVLKLRIMI